MTKQLVPGNWRARSVSKENRLPNGQKFDPRFHGVSKQNDHENTDKPLCIYRLDAIFVRSFSYGIVIALMNDHLSVFSLLRLPIWQRPTDSGSNNHTPQRQKGVRPMKVTPLSDRILVRRLDAAEERPRGAGSSFPTPPRKSPSRARSSQSAPVA